MQEKHALIALKTQAVFSLKSAAQTVYADPTSLILAAIILPVTMMGSAKSEKAAIAQTASMKKMVAMIILSAILKQKIADAKKMNTGVMETITVAIFPVFQTNVQSLTVATAN